MATNFELPLAKIYSKFDYHTTPFPKPAQPSIEFSSHCPMNPGLTSFSSPLPHTLPSRSIAFRLMAARLVLISSYVANWIDPFETPTRARRDPRYNPRIPSVR